MCECVCVAMHSIKRHIVKCKHTITVYLSVCSQKASIHLSLTPSHSADDAKRKKNPIYTRWNTTRLSGCSSVPVPRSMFYFHSHKFAKCSMATSGKDSRQHVSHTHTQVECSLYCVSIVYDEFCTRPFATPSLHWYTSKHLAQCNITRLNPPKKYSALWYLSVSRH